MRAGEWGLRGRARFLRGQGGSRHEEGGREVRGPQQVLISCREAGSSTGPIVPAVVSQLRFLLLQGAAPPSVGGSGSGAGRAGWGLSAELIGGRGRCRGEELSDIRSEPGAQACHVRTRTLRHRCGSKVGVWGPTWPPRASANPPHRWFIPVSGVGCRGIVQERVTGWQRWAGDGSRSQGGARAVECARVPA